MKRLLNGVIYEWNGKHWVTVKPEPALSLKDILVLGSIPALGLLGKALPWQH